MLIVDLFTLFFSAFGMMKFGVPGGCKEDAPAFLNKMNAWRDFVVKSYNQEKLSIPRLYSLPIIFRNLKHTKAADVS